MENKKHYFRSSKTITPLRTIQDGLLGIQGGKIIYVGHFDLSPPLTDSVVHDYPGKIIIPGLIDIHIHGYGGYGGFGMGRVQGTISHEILSTQALSRLLPRHGVTAFLPTVSGNFANIPSIIAGIDKASDYNASSFSGARVLGINLEGPFLNPACSGALISKSFCSPSRSMLENWFNQSSGKLSIMTLAPELPGGAELIKALKELGIIPAIGHSDALYEKVEESVSLGLRHVTHAFNAMKGFHHRDPGVVGALLLLPELTTEIIADGFHLHTAAIKLLLQAKGWEKMILISDSMPWAGLPDGKYRLQGSEAEFVSVRDGKSSLADGRLAGSLVTIREGVMKMASEVKIPLDQVLAMASINPAKLLNQDRYIGSLEIGKKADFVVIDEDFQIELTVVDGKIAYRSELSQGKTFE